LAQKIRDGQGSGMVKENTLLELHMDEMVEALRDNREQLIAQNMIEEGVDDTTAEANIGLLLDVLGVFRQFDARLLSADGELSLEFQIQLNAEESGNEVDP
jgi:hypothetical protein